MKVKKSVVVSLSNEEKRALGRLYAHMGVGFIGSEDSPVDCHAFDCGDCLFFRSQTVNGYHCLINQMVSLKLELRSMVSQIKDGYNIKV